MIEEGHNNAAVSHCLSVVVRQYASFYYIRFPTVQIILGAVQRLFAGPVNLEARRLSLDVCETIIRWEEICQKCLTEYKTQKSNPTSAEASSIAGNYVVHF